ncbi:MAG: hypothetical protein Kow0077_13570 [Anaerolineae bacterium]
MLAIESLTPDLIADFLKRYDRQPSSAATEWLKDLRWLASYPDPTERAFQFYLRLSAWTESQLAAQWQTLHRQEGNLSDSPMLGLQRAFATQD